MSFQQGLSGLNAASKSLDTIGNNVANANTVGFKQSRAEFADVFANSLSGGGTSQIGIGTKISNVQQQFTQGNITNTDNPLDISINGGGFFRLSDNGSIVYSRNGQFQMDKEGYIVTAAGNRLTGYLPNPANPATLQTGAPMDLKINAADLPARQTTSIDSLINLDASKAVPVTTPFNANDPTSYTNSTTVNVFDSLGNSHLVQNFFIKTAPNTWTVNTTVDGAATTPASTSTLNFSTAGKATGTTTQTIAFTPPGSTAMSVVLDFAGSTQFSSAFSINSLAQDGFTSGRLAGFSTGADGTIKGNYTNGQSATLGQVLLANFANPNGLQNLGNNVWAETSASGVPVNGTPNSGSLGVLQSNSLEDSNVDLTAELVNMITAQRYYQANAQTIKTQDQVLQTLVNLR